MRRAALHCAIPFLSLDPIVAEDIRRFVSDFLGARLSDAALREQAADFSRRWDLSRQPAEVRGVSESYEGAEGIEVVGLSNYTDLVMDETADVVLLVHSRGCADSAHLAPFFKRFAARFKSMNLPGLRVARIDVSALGGPPPQELALAKVPSIYLLPAFGKSPPLHVYGGVSRVLPMMQWVQSLAHNRFELPDLAQLDEGDREEYRRQVRERESARRRNAKRSEL